MDSTPHLKVAFFFIICSLTRINNGAKILGVFPSTSYSQYILGSTIMKELAAKGHDVTLISLFSEKNTITNLKNITVELILDPVVYSNELYSQESTDVFSNTIDFYGSFGLMFTEYLLKSPKVQDLLQSNVKFDLVILEIFANEAHMGFAHHYNAPLILFNSVTSLEWCNQLIGNPAPFSNNPMMLLGYNNHLNFWQRYMNSLVGTFTMLYRNLYVFPKHNEILQRYFPNAPDIFEIMYNSSLVLHNTNVVLSTPTPRVTNVIDIGGFHVSPKELPPDLKKYLDDSVNGSIFFSMGSNLRTSTLSNATKKALLTAFSKLKQTVLWKWEDDTFLEKPKNVKIGKWLPQQDILAHPNVRAFITHGGLLSTTEALFNGVPLICIPIFGDQKMNCKMSVENNYGLKLAFDEVNEQNLTKTLQEILTNDSYRNAALRKSAILQDQLTKPLNRAIYWIEYVIRHKGAHHLKSSSLDLTWYQYYLLDLMGFVLIIIIAMVLLLKSSKNLFKKLKLPKPSKKKKIS